MVFLGAWGALALMTALSVAIGLILPNMLSRFYTHWAVTLIFAYFGASSMFEASRMLKSGEGAGVSNELNEVEQELNEKKGQYAAPSYHIIMNIFVMVFLAEWGDKSQIATIAMAAARNTSGVLCGAVLGHAICTGIAVIGGRFLATRISERSVILGSGVLFLFFALHGLVSGSDA